MKKTSQSTQDWKLYNNRKKDLEERTFCFARGIREFLKKVPKNQSNFEYAKQLIRSSSSIAANYIEANEALSKKDFFYRIRISKKEAKESKLWLRLVEVGKNQDLKKEQMKLIQEALEYVKIFSAVCRKSKN